MRLFLIRHGQTTANVDHALDTALPGAPLTDLGEAQAAALPGRLAGERFDGVWCSPAVRAQQTAAPLAAALGLAPVVLPGVHEVQAGDSEMSTERADWLAFVQLLERWIRGDLSESLPGGESAQEAIDRVDADVALLEASGVEAAAIVAHGAIIRVWTAVRAPTVDRDFLVHHRIDNTGYVVLDGSPQQGWRLVAWHGEVPAEPLDPIAEPDAAELL